MRLRISDLAKLRGKARDEALVALGILDPATRTPQDLAKFRQYIKKAFEDQAEGKTIAEIRVLLQAGEIPESPLIHDWLLCEDKFENQNVPEDPGEQGQGQALAQGKLKGDQ